METSVIAAYIKRFKEQPPTSISTRKQLGSKDDFWWIPGEFSSSDPIPVDRYTLADLSLSRISESQSSTGSGVISAVEKETSEVDRFDLLPERVDRKYNGNIGFSCESEDTHTMADVETRARDLVERCDKIMLEMRATVLPNDTRSISRYDGERDPQQSDSTNLLNESQMSPPSFLSSRFEESMKIAENLNIFDIDSPTQHGHGTGLSPEIRNKPFEESSECLFEPVHNEFGVCLHSISAVEDKGDIDIESTASNSSNNSSLFYDLSPSASCASYPAHTHKQIQTANKLNESNHRVDESSCEIQDQLDGYVAAVGAVEHMPAHISHLPLPAPTGLVEEQRALSISHSTNVPLPSSPHRLTSSVRAEIYESAGALVDATLVSRHLDRDPTLADLWSRLLAVRREAAELRTLLGVSAEG